MNHKFYTTPISPGRSSIEDTCSHCGQRRRRYANSTTVHFEQLDGRWIEGRPGPCSRNMRMLQLAKVINQLVEFHEVKQAI